MKKVIKQEHLDWNNRFIYQSMSSGNFIAVLANPRAFYHLEWVKIISTTVGKEKGCWEEKLEGERTYWASSEDEKNASIYFLVGKLAITTGSSPCNPRSSCTNETT